MTRFRRLNSFVKEDLCMLVVNQEDAMKDLEQEHDKSKKQVTYWKHRACVLEERNQTLKTDAKALIAQHDLRPNRNITIFGGYSLAHRRNMGHCSALVAARMVTEAAFGGEVKDRKSVLMYEHRLACAKTRKSALMYEDALSADTDVSVHSYKADATHQQAVEKSKVGREKYCIEYSSIFLDILVFKKCYTILLHEIS